MSLRLSWRKNWPDLEALLRGGFPSFVRQRDPSGLPGGIPVFCYHTADPEAIEADFTFLKDNGYRTVAADDVGAVQDDRSIALTVDDGASDLYRILFPALRRYGFHATAFVATAFHRDHYEWPDAARPCTWAELAEMDRSGHVNIQSHTHTHRYIPNWPEPLDLVGIDRAYSRGIQAEPSVSVKADLARSKQELETRLGKSVTHLAFPMYQGTSQAVQDGLSLGYTTFWWGTLSGRQGNLPGDPATHRVRLDAAWLRRLPGTQRLPLTSICARRFRKAPLPG